MNIQVNAKKLLTGSEVREHAAAVLAKRRRMFAGVSIAPVKIAAEAVEEKVVNVVDLAPFREMPEWKRQRTEFDAHVVEHRNLQGRPIATYIATRAADFWFSPADLVRKGRLKTRECAVRDRIAAELKTANPALSWGELARVFNRDHTSMFWGVHQVWASEGNEESIAKVANRKMRIDTRYHASKTPRTLL